VVARAIDLAKRPLAFEGLLEALDLAVGLRAIRPGPQVADAVASEQLGERLVFGVGKGVVCHQAFRMDPVRLEEDERSLNKEKDRVCTLVLMQLAVGKSGVIIDDRVHELVPGTQARLASASVADPGHCVTGPCEAGEALRVHV